jgi:hypothetical protein
MNISKNISAADLQVRKLTLIECLARLDDITAIKEIEAILKKRRIANYEKSLKPMTEADLIRRIDLSEKDVKEGRVISHSEVKKLIATWK